MLKLEQLTFTYPDKQFRFTLEIPRGARVAIWGPSGLGKTTLLNLIAGFLTSQSGQITWEGISLNSLTIGQRPIAYLFQSHNVFEHLTAVENIKLGLYSLPRHVRLLQKASLEEILQMLDLTSYQQCKVANLSGGQKQRVALGRLLLQGQPLWLLDEPFNGLDLATKMMVYQSLIHWQQRTHATILFTTHHENEIQAFATHHASLELKGNITSISRLTPVTEGIVMIQ